MCWFFLMKIGSENGALATESARQITRNIAVVTASVYAAYKRLVSRTIWIGTISQPVAGRHSEYGETDE